MADIKIEKRYMPTSTVIKSGCEEMEISDLDMVFIKDALRKAVDGMITEALTDPDFGNPNIIRNGRSRPMPPVLDAPKED